MAYRIHELDVTSRCLRCAFARAHLPIRDLGRGGTRRIAGAMRISEDAFARLRDA